MLSSSSLVVSGAASSSMSCAARSVSRRLFVTMTCSASRTARASLSMSAAPDLRCHDIRAGTSNTTDTSRSPWVHRRFSASGRNTMSPRKRRENNPPPRKIRPARGSNGDNDNNDNSNMNDADRPPNPQDFVKVKLEPGEWDYETHTDPIYRPPWKNRAEIMSAEDFANRPKAGFSEEFDSLHDAMVVLGWLSQADCDSIYQSYLDMMMTMSRTDRGVTSHEYVMRVIAQRYNISAARVAAIVQLAHEEDQIRRTRPDVPIRHDLQEYVDAKIRAVIQDCYDAYGEINPGRFVEDPVGVAGVGNNYCRDSRPMARVEDLVDVDELMKRAVVREKEEARLAIDGKVYIEDVDESEQEVAVNAECRKLMKVKNRYFSSSALEQDLTEEDKEEEKDGGEDDKEEEEEEHLSHVQKDIHQKLERPEELSPMPDPSKYEGGVRRPRWKFALKTINTREVKAKHGRVKEENTLIEQDGTLRVATVEEVKNTAWKPQRNPQEFTYQRVKKAWLNRTLRGEVGGWGRVEERRVLHEEAESISDKSENENDEAGVEEDIVESEEEEEEEREDEELGDTGDDDEEDK